MRFTAGLSPDPLGKLQRSPRPPSRYKERGRLGIGKGGEGREGREGVGTNGKANGGMGRGRW